ncbi:CBS domain-containing protein [Microtetraspora niveoalba]|uniref:CBS domain-containing protein n=1 Tax=Microtetraspora niveoalba TaxID=46175 RepID=UPI0008336C46|nr:CBS domain-containing protein [Microtetraspora niveoalba]
MSVTVKDVMGRVAIAVQEDAGFADIAAAMERFRVGAVAVVDAERRPVGVVSEDDLLLRETGAPGGPGAFLDPGRRREHRKAVGVTAAEIMSTPPVTVTPGTPVRVAARLMHERRIKQLPVVDPISGRIAGTVHQSDLLRIFNRPVEDLRADIVDVIRREADPECLEIVIESGMVTIRGRVRRRSQICHIVEAVRAVEGVIDVTTEITFAKNDLVVPPLR